MRLLIKKDLKIKKREFNKLKKQFTDLYKENANITPVFFVEEHDFSDVPQQTDGDGDTKPTKAYRKAIADDVFARYTEFGTDHIILLVHEDNWKFKGIWGTSWSLLFHTYHMQLCRFDKDNAANSLGTLYHEVMHSHDSLIKTTVGVNVDKLFGFDFDHGIVHGNDKNYDYIRYKENTDALAYISPYLKASYAKRERLNQKNVKLMETLITTAQKYIILWNSIFNKKDGVPRK